MALDKEGEKQLALYYKSRIIHFDKERRKGRGKDLGSLPFMGSPPWLVDGFIPSAFREGKVELRSLNRFRVERWK